MTHVEVQYTTDCPNARVIILRLEQLAQERADLTLSLVEVVSDRPVPAGFVGSPTVLIDDTNPFGGTVTDSPACALHPPTIEQVEAAIAPD